MQWLDVVSVRLLNEDERRQVTPKRGLTKRPVHQRKHRIKAAAPTVSQPEQGFILLT
jgi:hypothetical protein